MLPISPGLPILYPDNPNTASYYASVDSDHHSNSNSMPGCAMMDCVGGRPSMK